MTQPIVRCAWPKCESVAWNHPTYCEKHREMAEPPEE